MPISIIPSYDIKRALQSIILTPIWDQIKSGGDCKVKNSNKSSNAGRSMPTKSSQLEIFHLKYHGSKVLKKQSVDQESMINCFSSCLGPFQKLIGTFASVSNEQIPIPGREEVENKSKVRLQLNRICRVQDELCLGYEGNDVRTQLHMKTVKLDKKNNEPIQLVSGDTLRRLILQETAGVVKLLAHQKAILNTNGELPSGMSEDEFLTNLLQKAWIDHKWSDLNASEKVLAAKANSPAASAAEAVTETAGTSPQGNVETSQRDENTSPSIHDDSQIDSDLEGSTPTQNDDDNDDAIVIEQIPAPDSWQPTDQLPDTWTPRGWSIYVVFVCKFTRCTDDYLHLYTYEGTDIKNSSAKSRKEARTMVAEEKNLNRDFEIVDGKGYQMEKATALANVGVKRSADMFAATVVATNTHTKSMEMIMEEISQKQQRLELLKNMPNQVERVNKLLDEIDQLEEEKQRVKEVRNDAIMKQINFHNEDEIGNHANKILKRFLTR